MTGRIVFGALGLMILAGILILLSLGAAATEDTRRVIVTNFPDTQRVRGSVSIDGIVPHATLVTMKEIEVQPVNRGDTRRLVVAGTLPMDGFSSVVLSLTGQPKGHVSQSGEVGGILVPDEEPVVRAFEEKGQFQFPFEVRAPIAAGMPYFNSDQPRYIVGFPRYRVLLFNTTDRTVTVTLYAYLTN